MWATFNKIAGRAVVDKGSQVQILSARPKTGPDLRKRSSEAVSVLNYLRQTRRLLAAMLAIESIIVVIVVLDGHTFVHECDVSPGDLLELETAGPVVQIIGPFTGSASRPPRGVDTHDGRAGEVVLGVGTTRWSGAAPDKCVGADPRHRQYRGPTLIRNYYCELPLEQQVAVYDPQRAQRLAKQTLAETSASGFARSEVAARMWLAVANRRVDHIGKALQWRPLRSRASMRPAVSFRLCGLKRCASCTPSARPRRADCLVNVTADPIRSPWRSRMASTTRRCGASDLRAAPDAAV